MDSGQKADTAKRIVAVFIDYLIAAGIYFVLNLLLTRFLGWTGAFIFLLFRDALPIRDLDGASPGKKLLHIKARRQNGENCDIKASLKRNVAIGLGFLAIGLLRIYWGHRFYFGEIAIGFIFGLAGVIAISMELYKVMTDTHGKRLGDILAGTTVVEQSSECPS